MSTLLEISSDLLTLDYLLEEMGGEVTDTEVAEAIDRWFAEIGEQLNQKVDNYVALIRTCELRAAARQAEIDRLAVRVRVDTNKARALKEGLKLFFEVQGIKKLETMRYSIRVQTNGGKLPVEVYQAEDVPEEYRRVFVTETEDKDTIRAALESGKDVPGCRLLPRGTSLRIA